MSIPQYVDFNISSELCNENSGLEVRPIEHSRDAMMLQKPQLHEHASSEPYESSFKQSGRIVPFGLRYLTFGALIAVLTLLIVGGALGGGLGSSLATARHGASPSSISLSTMSTISSSSTASPTATASSTAINNYAVPQPFVINSLASNCENGSIYQTLQQALSLTSYRQQTFQYLCDRAYKGSTIATRGGSVKTLASFISYTVENCIEACSNMNGWASETVCRAITFGTRLAESYTGYGTNCWLFNDTGGWAREEFVISAALE